MTSTQSSVSTPAAIVFAGGMGLGSYQAGAYERLHDAKDLKVDWLVGSSVGAVNAALIAGGRPDGQIKRLRDFWSRPNIWQPKQLQSFPADVRHAQNWMSALHTRLFGAWGHFWPRSPALPFESFRSLYDLSPMRRTLERLIDFSQLNAGDMRLSIGTTDIETGEFILFDTREHTITIDHLMASCGMLPEFAPVEINGRLLADGGLAANAPVEAVLMDQAERVIYVLDLFARDGGRPKTLTEAIARKNDLMFGNQTLRILEYWRDVINPDNRKRVIYLSYQARSSEAGPERLFDMSAATISERWECGSLDMEVALREANEGLVTIRRFPLCGSRDNVTTRRRA